MDIINSFKWSKLQWKTLFVNEVLATLQEFWWYKSFGEISMLPLYFKSHAGFTNAAQGQPLIATVDGTSSVMWV